MLEVSRLYKLVGDEALRATMLALQTLKDRGVAHPERNVVVVLGHDVLGELFGTVLVRNEPWTAAQLARVSALARARGGQIAFAPGGPYRLEWRGLHAAKSPQAFCAAYRLDVCAPTDDKPFFFQMTRLSSLGSHSSGYIYATDPFEVLLVTFAILAALSLALVAAPLVLTSRDRRPPMRSLVFFAAIGVGFLAFEVVLIQRLVLMLGFPTYALSVALFALLLWTGVGSWLTSGVRDERRMLLWALSAACLFIAIGVFALLPLIHALIGASFSVRVLVTVVLLGPIGIAWGWRCRWACGASRRAIRTGCRGRGGSTRSPRFWRRPARSRWRSCSGSRRRRCWRWCVTWWRWWMCGGRAGRWRGRLERHRLRRHHLPRRSHEVEVVRTADGSVGSPSCDARSSSSPC